MFLAQIDQVLIRSHHLHDLKQKEIYKLSW